MSKRSKEMALKAYPECAVYNDLTMEYEDINRDYRVGFETGYEQAEKDTIERAISVLVNLPSLVIPSNYIAYFRKQMMEDE